jgi:hypothetical protein
VRQHLLKLAMIVVLGSGFALAQSMPQSQTSPSTSPSTAPQTQQPSSPSTDQQQPSAVPDQSQKPETLPNTDQKKDDQGVKKDEQKLPQSDAAPAATGDVQNTIQSAIQKDPTLASASITVEVKNGKSVELSGTVPNKDAKDAAERIAKENAGGLKVKNHLKVASNSTPEKPKSDMSNPK